MADEHEHDVDAIFPGQRVGCFHASRGPFRFVLLIFTCMLTFGSYFCFDMPRNAIVVVLAGFLVDKLGNPKKYGLQWTLWGGAILCGLGVVCAVVASCLDVTGIKQMNKTTEMKIESKRMRLTDIKYFSSTFWLLAFCLMFFYIGVFPFIADASKFIFENYKHTFDFSKKTSAYIAGTVYLMSMIFGPLMGLFVDFFGRRGILIILCAVLSIPVFGLLAFAPHVHPLVSTIWLGFTYSMAAASLWPSFPLVVDQSTVGTALGLTTSIQMIGMGIANIVVGKMLDLLNSEVKWKYVMIFLLANTLACVTFAILVNISDKRKGGILNRPPRKRNHDPLIDAGPINTYGSITTPGYTNKDALLYDSSTSIN